MTYAPHGVLITVVQVLILVFGVIPLFVYAHHYGDVAHGGLPSLHDTALRKQAIYRVLAVVLLVLDIIVWIAPAFNMPVL